MRLINLSRFLSLPSILREGTNKVVGKETEIGRRKSAIRNPQSTIQDDRAHTDNISAPAVAAAVCTGAVGFSQPQPVQTSGGARAGHNVHARRAGDDSRPGPEPGGPIAVHRLFRAHAIFAPPRAHLRGRADRRTTQTTGRLSIRLP